MPEVQRATQLDGLDEAKKQVVVRARPADGVGLGDDEVQDGDALEAVAHVEDHADRPRHLALALDREQALRIGLAADPDAQGRALGHDLGRAVPADRRLDALAHPMLAPVEEQQHLELVIVLGWQGRYECNLADGRHSRCSPASGQGRSHLTGAFRPLSTFT